MVQLSNGDLSHQPLLEKKKLEKFPVIYNLLSCPLVCEDYSVLG